MVVVSSSISGSVSESVVGNWSMGIGDWSGNGVVSDGVVGNGEGSVVDNWSSGSVSDGWSGNDGGPDGWGRSVNNGVESIDGVSGVGDGPHGTIGLNKGVLSLNDISVAALVGGLLVSGEGIGHGVSVVVLWMRVIRLSTDGWGNSNWGLVVDWGVVDGVGNWGVGISNGWGGIPHSWSHGGNAGNWGSITDGWSSISGSSVSWSCGVGWSVSVGWSVGIGGCDIGWCCVTSGIGASVGDGSSGSGNPEKGKKSDVLEHDAKFL